MNYLTNMTDWMYEHPFSLVLIISSIAMFLLVMASMNSTAHQKHVKEIEEKKRKKALKK